MVLAAVTMTLGNLVALTQDNVKRMLAYSSIAHTGYMLVGLAAYAATGQIQEGIEALLFYGGRLRRHEPGRVRGHRRAPEAARRDLAASTRSPGWAASEPILAILMTLFLLSLTGIPPTAGFFAKAYVILAAVAGRRADDVLAVIAVLNAAAAAFYYLRVVVYMFMRDPASDAPALRHGRLVWSGLAVATTFTILLGLFPSRSCRSSARPPRSVSGSPP